ncbi:MAG: CHASE2 domain-containing protein [Candidatus Omnitrophica bacterium]|nr:CHASE2 domain-containing protein [Candidatus Omnitrophota bacterium]
MVYILGLFDNYELLLYDLRFKLRPRQKVSDDILIIQIYDDTLNNLGRWPLPRNFHTSLVRVLKEFGARYIIFDILFSEPTEHDVEFAQTIKAVGGVYIPVAFYLEEAYPLKKSAVLESPLILAGISKDLQDATSVISHANVCVDSDGKVRAAPLFIKHNSKLYPNLALQAACDWLGLNIQNVEFRKDKIIIDKRLILSVLSGAKLLVNYPGKWTQTFRHLSYFDILKSYTDIKKGLRPQIDLSTLKDKICFIGLTATGTSDLRPTPLESVYPMLGLQASVFNSIIQRSFIKPLGLPFNLILSWLVFALSLFVCFRLPAFKALLGSLCLGISYFIVTVVAFVFWGLWIIVFVPLTVVVVTYTITTTYRFFSETKKRQLLEKELEIARQIQESFLLKQIKELKGINIALSFEPAKFVAGDFYDVLNLDNGRQAVFIADVAGKGISAALIMAQAISLLRIFSFQYKDGVQVLSQLNKEFCGRFEGRFITGLYITIDTQNNNKVYVASAGHGPLLFYKKQQHSLLEPKLLSGLPLGLMEDTEYQQIELIPESGDKILIFTDGLSEARNRKGEEFGLDRIKKILLENADSSGKIISERFREAVKKFSLGCTQHDDITLIVISFGDGS